MPSLTRGSSSTVEGIEKYLGSGMIRAIGPVCAKKLVRAFGEAVFDVIEQEPPRLREVTGIGPKRRSKSSPAGLSRRSSARSSKNLHRSGPSSSCRDAVLNGRQGPCLPWRVLSFSRPPPRLPPICQRVLGQSAPREDRSDVWRKGNAWPCLHGYNTLGEAMT